MSGRDEADAALLMHSLPGEWISRRGRPQLRLEPRRILVIKPDHIGDLLIAAEALAQLRAFFPAARIELVCGSWNVGLARRLGLFDAVHGIDIFHQISDQQGDPEVAKSAKRRGLATLQKARLGHFDLAIDLRYDRDSRDSLTSIEAGAYAGFGSPSDYPFLDIALPVHEMPAPGEAAGEVVLSGRQFRGDGIAEPGGSRWPGTITADQSATQLYFTVDGARSPSDCGTVEGDRRPLGVALEAVALVPLDEAKAVAGRPLGEADGLRLNHAFGWDVPEAWGTWIIGSRARLQIGLPHGLRAPYVRLTLALRAHVNAFNPLVTCNIAAEQDAEGEVVRFTPTSPGVVTSVVVRIAGTRRRLVSDSFPLAAGSYRGLLRLYIPGAVSEGMELEIELRGDETGACVLNRRVGARELASGLCDVTLDFRSHLAREPLRLSVIAEHAELFEGATVELLRLTAVELLKPRLPIAHMQDWATLLVLRVAQLFSRVAPFGAPASPHVLTLPDPAQTPAAGATIDRLVGRIRAWQGAGDCVVAIALGCNSAIRTWPRHYYIELARGLLALGRVRLVFVGGPADQEDAAFACGALDLDAGEHAMCGAVKLESFGQVLAACDLFIGNNTGITHYAGRIGVRTIGIYSGTNHPREWGPVGPNASWIYRDEPCAPCSLTDLRDCRRGHVCLRNLLPGDVHAIAAPEVLAVRAVRARSPAGVS